MNTASRHVSQRVVQGSPELRNNPRSNMSIAGSISLVCGFYAMTHYPVSEVLTLTNMFPLWVAVLSLPLTFAVNACIPMAVLLRPIVLFFMALMPTAVFWKPVVVLSRAQVPNAELLVPVVFRWSER
jgi:hypothetical protein